MLWAIMSILLIFLFSFGIPVAAAIGFIATVILISIKDPNMFPIIGQVMTSSLNSFVLIAAPFFMLAGEVMNYGGLTRRVFNFANIFVGRLPGGLGHVNVIASVMFAGMTGSAISDAVGLGSIEIKSMVESGYDRDFSCAITAASSIIGPIIPPSIIMVIYGSMVDASVGALFLGGIIPGLLMGLFLMIGVYLYARFKKKCPLPTKPSRREIVEITKEAIPSLMAPVVILGGIYTGLFTPTEAAIVALSYALFLGFAVYRELKLQDLIRIVKRVGIMTGSIFFIVTTTSLLSWVITREGALVGLSMWIANLPFSNTTMLFLISAFLLLVGCFMEPLAALILLVPILFPITRVLGIDPVYFGVFICYTLCLGLLTPPVGMVLFAVVAVGKIPLKDLIIAVTPFFLLLIFVLILMIIFPSIVLFLPRLVL